MYSIVQGAWQSPESRVQRPEPRYHRQSVGLFFVPSKEEWLHCVSCNNGFAFCTRPCSCYTCLTCLIKARLTHHKYRRVSRRSGYIRISCCIYTRMLHPESYITTYIPTTRVTIAQFFIDISSNKRGIVFPQSIISGSRSPHHLGNVSHRWPNSAICHASYSTPSFHSDSNYTSITLFLFNLCIVSVLCTVYTRHQTEGGLRVSYYAQTAAVQECGQHSIRRVNHVSHINPFYTVW